MRALALLLLVSLTAQAQSLGRFDRFCDRSDTGRSDRGLLCGGAFFEAFGTDGRGTNGPCSTTAPTGAKGEALTFTRASSATCTKTATGGLATTGIADGDLVVLSSNVARVEYDSAGTLGLLVEAMGVDLLLRFIELCDAAWANVGTPALTGATVTGTACATATPQTSPFTGTYATAAVLVEDNDGAAYEGRSQSVTVSAGAAHTAHCYVKAGTLAEARITLDGTAVTITGLSAATWSIIEVTDASSSGVSIAFQVLNGDAVGDTGTVIWGGCDVKAGSYRTSIVPTAGATATRAAEVPYFVQSVPTTTGVCTAATLTSPVATAFTAGAGAFAPLVTSGSGVNSPYVWPYTGGTGTSLSIDGTGSSAAPTGFAGAQAAGTFNRYIASNTGSLWRICKDSTCTTTASGAWAGATYTHIKLSSNAGSEGASIWTRIVVDPDWTRCGP